MKYSNMHIKEFIYGQYRYQYAFMRQDRKTLSLTVRPDLSILLRCPQQATEERISIFLRKKRIWLNKQLKFFKKFQRTFYEREYVSGESFLYLGRQYQLIVKRSKENGVTLLKGRLMLFTNNYVSDGEHNKSLIEDWYEKKVAYVFNNQFDAVFKRFDYFKKPELAVRKMSKRWGSFLGYKKIILNPRLIGASKDCIDYVIAHELCHMKYRNHDKKFYQFLKLKIPDWEKKKDRLENSLSLRTIHAIVT